MKSNVYIDGGAASCAAGADIAAIWNAMAGGRQLRSPLPCPAFEGWPWPEVFLVEEPDAAALQVDRKLLRTMEKQSRLMLFGAAQALAAHPLPADADRSRAGLYLGLPTVDEAVPPMTVLETMHEEGRTVLDSELLHREVPAFFGLSTLNSNACAHISGTFGLCGSMGAYSPYADAGLQAVIDAALSVANGENTCALAGAVSPKINPPLLLQYEHNGWLADARRVPGEGVAFAMLSGAAAADSVRIAGYARGFILGPGQAAATRARVQQRALAMAGIGADQVDWWLPDGAADVTGDLGPAGPVLDLLLAVHAIRHRKRLRFVAHGQPQAEEAGLVRHVLVGAQGPEGQYAAVVVSGESK